MKYKFVSLQCTSKHANAVCKPHEELCKNCTGRECDNFTSPMESCDKIDNTCENCEYLKEVK